MIATVVYLEPYWPLSPRLPQGRDELKLATLIVYQSYNVKTTNLTFRGCRNFSTTKVNLEFAAIFLKVIYACFVLFEFGKNWQ